MLVAIQINDQEIKVGTWENNKLTLSSSFPTPTTLEEFNTLITLAVNDIKKSSTISGIALSIPGIIDYQTGTITGGSGISYLENTTLVNNFKKEFDVPVTLSSDSDSAALGLIKSEKEPITSSIILSIEHIISGSFIINNQLWQGAHKVAGEVGELLINDAPWSKIGAPDVMAEQYNKLTGKDFDANTVFDLGNTSDPQANEVVKKFFHILAEGIFNLQHTLDPARIYFTGAITKHPELLPLLEDELTTLKHTYHFTHSPILDLSTLNDEAILRGSIAYFEAKNN
ncbi:ROK family protein [Lactobacillus sp. PV012]|uniref:ROK family protein n=1 Tax=Lactobacillus sp. PV012 TaxID=2594494 RepID=UPI00223ECB92|nr:ROK family protein [Lactobacillus sp. PV012]QNQ81767.1 ROK family protein [Lactobacillus sp. PV012]